MAFSFELAAFHLSFTLSLSQKRSTVNSMKYVNLFVIVLRNAKKEGF